MFEFIKNLFSDKNSLTVIGNNNVVSNTVIRNGVLVKNTNNLTNDSGTPETRFYTLRIEDVLTCTLVGDVTINIDPHAEPTMVMDATPFFHDALRHNSKEITLPFSSCMTHNGSFVVDGTKTQRPYITITLPSLQDITLNGTANYDCDFHKTPDVTIQTLCVGHVNIKVQTQNLTIKQDSVADLVVVGTSDNVIVNHKGVGELDMSECSVEHGSLYTSGVGKTVAVIRHVDESITSGIGKVTLHAETIRRQQHDGIGKFKHKPLSPPVNFDL